MNIKGFFTKNDNLIAEIETSIGIDYAYLSMPKLKVLDIADIETYEWAKSWMATEATITPSSETQKAITRHLLNVRISQRVAGIYGYIYAEKIIRAEIQRMAAEYGTRKMVIDRSATYASQAPHIRAQYISTFEVHLEDAGMHFDVVRHGEWKGTWPTFNKNCYIHGRVNSDKSVSWFTHDGFPVTFTA